MSEAKEDRAYKAAKSAYRSIVEMVACLNADRERLAELREERDDWEPPTDEEIEERAASGGTKLSMSWADQNPQDAEELKELEAAVTLDGDELDEDQARERIQEDPLSLLVRSGWYTLGASDEDRRPEEFELLLSTGGPASRIIGELDENMVPCRSRIQGQDWFTPWVDYVDADQDVLLAYCRCFYFGD